MCAASTCCAQFHDTDHDTGQATWVGKYLQHTFHQHPMSIKEILVALWIVTLVGIWLWGALPLLV